MMKPVEFTFPLSEAQQKEKAKQVEALLKNSDIKAWQKRFHADDAFIFEHSGRFQDYVKVLDKCADCKGLTFCRQPMKGNRMELQYDGILQQVLTPCAYQTRELQEYAHQMQYWEMDMPKEHLRIDLARMDVTKERNDYKAVVMQVLQILMDEQDQKGIYLCGKPGVGKSYLAAGMCNYYAKKQYHVAFVNVVKLIADLKLMFHDNEAMEAKLRRIRRVDVLVLDDIGGESMTSWSRDDILLPILDERMEHKRKTIFTSNYRMQELKEKLAYGQGKQAEPMAAERILERISTLSNEIFVKGDSRRK